MSCYRLQRSGCIVCFSEEDIMKLRVDLVVRFVEPDLGIRTGLDEYVLGHFGGDFEKKWSRLRGPNEEKFLLTGGRGLPCDSILHTVSWYYKPHNIGYFNAISKKVRFCLQEAERKSISSIAFALESHNVEIILIKSLCDVLSNLESSHLKKIYFQSPKRSFCQNLDAEFNAKGLGSLVSTQERAESSSVPKPQPLLQPQTANLETSDEAWETSPVWENAPPSSFPAAEHASSAHGWNATPRIDIDVDVDPPRKMADIGDSCTICLCDFTDMKTLDKCGHSFCSACIDHSFSAIGPSCPICNMVYGEVVGIQPPGTMTVQEEGTSLPGFDDCGHYVIRYNIPSGIQQPNHPNPGIPFTGTNRTAFLPANEEGALVLKMLQRAFLQKLIFTVGFSRTTNRADTVTWNDIHHKTNINGGAFNFGYPDPNYLTRVTDELKAKGIEPGTVADESIVFQICCE